MVDIRVFRRMTAALFARACHFPKSHIPGPCSAFEILQRVLWSPVRGRDEELMSARAIWVVRRDIDEHPVFLPPLYDLNVEPVLASPRIVNNQVVMAIGQLTEIEVATSPSFHGLHNTKLVPTADMPSILVKCHLRTRYNGPMSEPGEHMPPVAVANTDNDSVQSADLVKVPNCPRTRIRSPRDHQRDR